jgi:hypothetical protein
MAEHPHQLVLVTPIPSWYVHHLYCVVRSKLNCWIDVMHVGKWVRNQFGRRHPVTATFMNHAVVNDNHGVRKSVPVAVPRRG